MKTVKERPVMTTAEPGTKDPIPALLLTLNDYVSGCLNCYTLPEIEGIVGIDGDEVSVRLHCLQQKIIDLLNEAMGKDDKLDPVMMSIASTMATIVTLTRVREDSEKVERCNLTIQ
jgi:hypothetical protein